MKTIQELKVLSRQSQNIEINTVDDSKIYLHGPRDELDRPSWPDVVNFGQDFLYGENRLEFVKLQGRGVFTVEMINAKATYCVLGSIDGGMTHVCQKISASVEYAE